MISVSDFLKAASESGRAAGTSAFVIDFANVQNIDEPTVERALLEHFERSASETTRQITRLAPREVACLCTDDQAELLLPRIEELNDMVSAQRLGSVRFDRYVLPRDLRSLADRVGAIVAESAASASGSSTRRQHSDITLLLGIEQMLRRADISSLIHHQSIYDFSKPRNPIALARELTVSMPWVAETLKIPVVESPWLFDKVTLILDRRMLFHLIQDRAPHKEPYAINLRVATVLDEAFPELISRLSARDHDTLIVELSEPDRVTDPAGFDLAVRQLDRLGIHVALHAGSWSELTAAAGSATDDEKRFMPRIDFLKVRWDSTDLDVTGEEAEAMAELVSKVGPHRLVLERVESEEGIEFGLRLGIRLMQGFGVTRYVQTRQAKERDRTAARARRNAPNIEEAEPERRSMLPVRFRKMLRL